MLTARALLLDMDSTLVDSTAVVERCWRRWADKHELDADAVVLHVHGRQGYLTMADWLPERPMAENYAENSKMLADETADTDGISEVPGAAVFLSAIQEFPHALVTSADDALAAVRMGAAGLPMPPLSVTADDVQHSKPHPQGFLIAAEKLGVPAEECIVLEDSEAGIEAARAAGMQVVGVGPRAAAHHPDLHVNDLTELPAVVVGDRVRLG